MRGDFRMPCSKSMLDLEKYFVDLGGGNDHEDGHSDELRSRETSND